MRKYEVCLSWHIIQLAVFVCVFVYVCLRNRVVFSAHSGRSVERKLIEIHEKATKVQ
jgi:hypothetical protein